MISMSELFWEGLRQRSVGPRFREEEACITQHWRLGAPEMGWEKTYETAEILPSPEPRFNLLIFLINHSPSSYPLQGSGFSPAQVPQASLGKVPSLGPTIIWISPWPPGRPYLGCTVSSLLPLRVSPSLSSLQFTSGDRLTPLSNPIT